MICRIRWWLMGMSWSLGLFRKSNSRFVDIGIFFTDRYLDIITAAPMVFDHGSFAIVSITNSRLIHHS